MDTNPLDFPQYAHRAGRLQLTRTDGVGHAMPPSGPTTWWDNRTTSFVLNFRSAKVHGETIADETDTVIQAVDSLRAGEEISANRLRDALQDVRRLRTRLAALESELILYARETGEDGRKRLPLRDVAEELGIHHTTVAERHARMEAGEHAGWRHWLVQDTAREAMYQEPNA
ncbi:AsnC family protein [Streptomyces anulatus]|uniref:AsnC family protein n=1 Tax=Streptomyces anulatus TaxID=1892 RepID=UPI0035DC5E9B